MIVYNIYLQRVVESEHGKHLRLRFFGKETIDDNPGSPEELITGCLDDNGSYAAPIRLLCSL